MRDLFDGNGKYRAGGVGFVTGSKVTHLAPPPNMVPQLMGDLFGYLKKSKETVLIKSCVFHYEMEFIHPFMDGNGRMGRLWQSLILGIDYPIFKYLPIESIVKQKQKEYYSTLSKCDKLGDSTLFILFMLNVISDVLDGVLATTHPILDKNGRIEIARMKFKNISFTRKDYLLEFKDISAPTASRDLKNAVDNGIISKSGQQRMTEYRFN